MKVSLIAAIAENGVIGRAGQLPWKIRDDMRFFVETTRGHAVITGRKNFDAMGRALPKRRNFVVTRRSELLLAGCEVVPTVAQALLLADDAGEKESFVIGGAQIYALAYAFAGTFYRTRVLATVQGDVVFPRYEQADWSVRELFRGEASPDNEHPFVVEELTRVGSARSFR